MSVHTELAAESSPGGGTGQEQTNDKCSHSLIFVTVKGFIIIVFNCLLQVILHGEHSVVYGKTALAASVDLRTLLVIKVVKESKNYLIRG